MKPIFKRLVHFPSSGKPGVVDPDETLPEAQSPLQQAMTNACVACFVTLMFVYWAARPLVARLGVWWVETLIYAIIPITVTFVILCRGCWHREMAGVPRVCSLVLISCAIFGGVLLAACAMAALVSFVAIAIPVYAGGR